VRRAERGFSLTEALAVAALLAALVIVAAPRLVVPEPLQAGVPARELAGDLRLAQRLAIARGVDFVLEFSPATPPYGSYTVRQVGGTAEPDFPKSVPSGVAVSGPQQFVFRRDGSAASGGTVTLTASGATAAVEVVQATGRVRVAMP
jgi:Tfp pilus assembly protein FimT